MKIFLARKKLGLAILLSFSNPLHAQVGETMQVTRLTPIRAASPPSQLPEELPGGQTARGGRAGILGNKDIMNLPFSLSSYTSKLLTNQQMSTVADALALEPSVSVSQTGGMVDSYSIRGFPIGEGNVGEIAYDGIYGIAPNYRVFNDYVERIEVLKGATGMLYGMSPDSGVGGVINVVPKRPLEEDLTKVGAAYGMRSLWGGHVDLSRKFGAERNVGIRFNGGYKKGRTPVKHQRKEDTVGALALDYNSDKLRINLDMLYQREDWKNPSRVYTLPEGVSVPDAPDGENSPTQRWGWSKMKDHSILLGAEYNINDNFSIYGNAGYGNSRVSRLYDQTIDFINEEGDFRTTPRYAEFEVKRNTATIGARGSFNTAAIRHDVNLQYSALKVINYQGSINGSSILSNLYNPVFYPSQDVARPDMPKRAEINLSGISISDTLSMFNERLQLILGLRYQNVNSKNYDPLTGATTTSYRKDALTPSVGLIFRPTDNTMVYGSYIEGLSKGDVAPSTALNAGETFAPYKTKQYELGFKADIGNLNAGVSLFQITKPSGQLESNVFDVNAEQRNRGLELTLQGQVTQGLRVFSGATFLDAELTKTNNQATKGNRPVGVPRFQANLGLEWDVPKATGLTLMGNLIYSGKQYVNQTNTANLPAWTRVDVGARYNTQISGRAVTLRANLQNAFNKKYWSGVASYGSFSLGSPRTLLVSAELEF